MKSELRLWRPAGGEHEEPAKAATSADRPAATKAADGGGATEEGAAEGVGEEGEVVAALVQPEGGGRGGQQRKQ